MQIKACIGRHDEDAPPSTTAQGGILMLTHTHPPADAISIDPEQVCFIILKAREFDVKVAPDDPDSGSNPTDDRDVDILEELADDSTLLELTGAIEALNADQKAELLAMCWLGRGDYEAREWFLALRQARRSVDAHLLSYLLGTPLLGDFLEEGYSQLGYSCDDVELGRL